MGNSGSRARITGGPGSQTRTTLDAAVDAEFVPTKVDINRCRAEAELTSDWWAQVQSAPFGVALKAYGKAYGKLFAKTCGAHRQEFKRCMEKHRLDLFNLAAWYPVCGESAELENACASSLIRAVDAKCAPVLDRAARKLAGASSADAKAAALTEEEYGAISRCVSGVTAKFEEAQQKAAKERYQEKRAPFTYNFAAGGAGK
mmetsp:Transcript_18775/g.46958  ORF Transcript_18775/g.46958 Transcript_18775/m.46958 type:complete len:202 (-) Transcript_18775:82-687(-)